MVVGAAGIPGSIGKGNGADMYGPGRGKSPCGASPPGSSAIGVNGRTPSTLLRIADGIAKEFLMRLTALFPHGHGLRIVHVCVERDLLTLTAQMTARTARCPFCRRPSQAVHSRYQRRVTDLPCGGCAVTAADNLVAARSYRVAIFTPPSRSVRSIPYSFIVCSNGESRA